MLNIHSILLGRLFIYATISFFLIDYLQPRKNKTVSFFGYIACVWILNTLALIITHIEESYIISFEPTASPTAFYFISYVLFILAHFLGAHINFKATIIKKILITFSVIIIGFIVEAVVLLIARMMFDLSLIENFSNLFAPLTLRLNLLGFAGVAINALFLSVFFRILQRKEIKWEKKNIFITFMFVSLLLLICVFLMNLLYELESFSPFYQIVIIAMPITILMLFVYLIFISNKKLSLELKVDNDKALITAQAKHIKEIIEQSSEIEKLKHDFATHSKIICDLAETENYEDLRKYLNDFKDRYNVAPLLFCSRGALNAILSNKYKLAESEGIDVQIYFATEGSEEISDIDLCSVVANLLQNAIEACERLDKDANRHIRLSASGKANCFIITQTNTSLEPNVGYKTHKSDTKNHGIGLRIIKDIAEKYNGSVSFDFEDGIFKSTVVFSK